MPKVHPPPFRWSPGWYPYARFLYLGTPYTHYDVLPHRVFVGVVEDFGRLLMQYPVPIFVLLGFHFLVKSSVVICFVHNEHLLQNRNIRLISFENQAAMCAIFSSTNRNLSRPLHFYERHDCNKHDYKIYSAACPCSKRTHSFVHSAIYND